jgi:DNA repair exonuclease SbcCD ATPase subunit
MARKTFAASPLDDEIRRLYRLPLGEFTAVRNSLAKQLQKQGDGDAANEVKALPKPSVSAWVVNQLFAREADHMRSLLDAGERARRALQHTLTVGDAETLRDALQEQRAQRDALRQRASEILSKDLRNPSQAVLDRVTVNLDALALSPGAAEEAARGWLDQDLEPPGFEVLSGLQFAARPERRGLRLVPSPAEKKLAAPKPAEKKPAAKAAPRRAPAADKAAAEAERRHKAEEAAREREETRRRERIERAEEKVDRLAAEADTLRREAERAERTAAEAEKAAQEATRRADLARQDAERIRRRAERAASDVDRAERDLEAARRSGTDK